MNTKIDVTKLKVNELKAELMMRGLDSKGLKSALVERLREALEKEGNLEAEKEANGENAPTTEQPQESQSVNDFSEIDKEIGNDQAPNDSQYLTAEDDESSEKIATNGEAESKVTNNDSNVDVITSEIDEKSIVEQDSVAEESADKDVTDKNAEIEANISIEVDTNKLTEVDMNQTAKVDVNQSAEAEANQSVEAVANQSEKVEASQSKKAEANQSVETDANQSTEADVTQSAEVDATQSAQNSSSDRNSNKYDNRRRYYEIENEPKCNEDAVVMSWNDSDLNLEIYRTNFLKIRPLHNEIFGYMWAGGRATYGVNKGKVYYELKITDICSWKDVWISKTNTMKDVMSYGKHNRDHDKDDNSHEFKKTKVSEEVAMEQVDTKGVMESSDKVEEKKRNGKAKSEAQIAIERQVAMEGIDYSKDNDISTPIIPVENTSVTLVEEEISEEEKEKQRIDNISHCIRVGWSVLGSNYLLGEDKLSLAYDTVGYKISNSEFVPLRIPGLKEEPEVGDKLTVFLDIDENNFKMYVTYNSHEITEDNLIFDLSKNEMGIEEDTEVVFYPHISIRNFSAEVKFGGPSAEIPKPTKEKKIDDSNNTEKSNEDNILEDVKKEVVMAEDVIMETKKSEDVEKMEIEEAVTVMENDINGFTIIGQYEHKIRGLKRIEFRDQCEVVLMIGMPLTGKTQWANIYSAEHPDKHFYILGKEQLREKMKMNGHVTKVASEFQMDKCLNHLLSFASRRRRNFIIDDSSLYLKTQQKRMYPFRGYNRKAVLMVIPVEQQNEVFERMSINNTRIMEMKANIWIPKKDEYVDVLEFGNLPEKEAREVLEKFIKEGKDAGFSFYDRRNWGDMRRDHFMNRNMRNQNWQYNVGPWMYPPYGYYAPYSPRNMMQPSYYSSGYRNQRNWNSPWGQCGYQGWGYGGGGQQYGNRRNNRPRNRPGGSGNKSYNEKESDKNIDFTVDSGPGLIAEDKKESFEFFSDDKQTLTMVTKMDGDMKVEDTKPVSVLNVPGTE